MAESRSPRLLPPGSTIGILGGGQLGRMLALAAARIGMRSHVYCPEPDSPAFQVTDRRTIAAYEDDDALVAFARSVDVVTYEFENVPAGAGALLARHVIVAPDPAILAITQDRLTEKSFIQKQGLNLADFASVAGPAELEAAAGRIGYPCVLKTRKFGYDGKGQQAIREPDGLNSAWAAIGARPAILESFVRFSSELSVIVGRGADGTLVCFDVPENRHENHILRSSTVPAAIAPETEAAAKKIGRTIAEALSYVGVMAVELFLVDTPAGPRLLVNEIAPRVHNSGHWTMDACSLSQFDLHIRAIAGWPLPPPQRHFDVVMTNLLGAEIFDSAGLAADPATIVHIYGKQAARPGRKMGHVNRLRPLGRR
ncbi:MAG: 5-(carboxyamino)imidazole ribonucleotide synthase [Aestuariivirgaceae bacterium]